MSASGSSLRPLEVRFPSVSWRALVSTEHAMTGLIVLAPLRGGLGGGHITPRRVAQGTRGGDPFNPCPSMVYGRQVFLEHTKIPCDNSFVP